MNHLIDTDDEVLTDSEIDRREESKQLKFLETLIDKLLKRLDEDSYKPRVQDALKAIQLRQKVAKTSEDEKIFWQEIENIRNEELPKRCPDPNNLESQIKATIFGLRFQVKNGILPVKTITDTLNQDKSKEIQFTYQRIGRLLSSMGFIKVKTPTGSSAILWDDNLFLW